MTNRAITKDEGFTLLDVLVALVVTGLAGSILIGLVSFIHQSTTRLQAEAETAARLTAIRLILTSLAREAYSPALNAPEISRPHGTETAFSVRTRGPAILGLGQSAVFQVLAQSAGQTSDLLLEWRDPDDGKPHRELLVGNLESAGFTYFGAIEGSKARTWRVSWEPGDRSPEAVRLSIKARGFPTPFEIVVPFRAELPSACLRNPRHPGCAPSRP